MAPLAEALELSLDKHGVDEIEPEPERCEMERVCTPSKCLGPPEAIVEHSELCLEL